MFLAQDVFNAVRALLNDQNNTMFSDTVIMPYLNMALADLRVRFQAYDIPVVNRTETGLEIPAETTEIIFNATSPAPSLPKDLIEPLELYERTSGVDENYIPMQRVQFLPPFVNRTNNLIYWAWQDQKIKFIGANADVEIRIDYTSMILPKVTDKDDQIDVLSSQPFLNYRTAALVSSFIGENVSRATELNTTAQLELEHVLTIGIKGGQSIAIRRRPFQQSYKLWNSEL